MITKFDTSSISPQGGKGGGSMTTVLVAALLLGGAYYYFAVYKPAQDAKKVQQA
jgi:uncharacterized protein HemX